MDWFPNSSNPTKATLLRVPSMHPRAFFQAYVLPTLGEWSTDSCNIRRTVFALCQLDILAEHVVIHLNPGIEPNAVSAERRKLCVREPALELAWDVHDTHKHGALTKAKRVRRISRGQQPSVVLEGVAFQPNAFQATAFQTGTEKITLTLDDGTARDAEEVIDACLAFWRVELDRLGL
jgi:hypothetical protein